MGRLPRSERGWRTLATRITPRQASSGPIEPNHISPLPILTYRVVPNPAQSNPALPDHGKPLRAAPIHIAPKHATDYLTRPNRAEPNHTGSCLAEPSLALPVPNLAYLIGPQLRDNLSRSRPPASAPSRGLRKNSIPWEEMDRDRIGDAGKCSDCMRRKATRALPSGGRPGTSRP